MSRPRILLLPLLFLSPMTASLADRLTVDDIFSAGGLNGPQVRGLEFSPDGSRVTYLRGKEEDSLQQDLWEYHIADDEHRMLVDSLTLFPDEEKPDEIEKARRERQRIGGRGIVEYYWNESGTALLFPLGGDLYLYDLEKEGTGKSIRLTHDDAWETDARFSPLGSYVSFVKHQDIHIIDIESGLQQSLTEDGEGVIKNGVAEFIAQEEMGRDSGYWWSPDESRIAFTRIDESPVEESGRYAIFANGFKVTAERYPYTGRPNVRVELGILKLADGSVTWMDLGDDDDIYLNRVDWLPDASSLTWQWQTRDQKTHELRLADPSTGGSRSLVKETSNTWTSLHDDLWLLESSDQFIWSSQRSGYRHLYLFNMDGSLVRPLTSGEWPVRELIAVDETAGHIYFTAYASDPLAPQFYRAALGSDAAAEMELLTSAEASHSITMSPDASAFIDHFSMSDEPPQTRLRDNHGNHITWIMSNELNQDHPYSRFLEHHVSPEFGQVEAGDGQTLYYRLLKPYNFDPDDRYPVVVYVYGGPGVQIVNRSWGGDNALFLQLLQQNGYIVFSIDNRGSANRGTAFEAPIYGQMSVIEVMDQVRGVEFLKTLPYVDGSRIGITGSSYGGYMTLMAMLQAPETFHVGVAWAPVTDWALYDTHYTERYMGTPAANPNGYQASNVLTYAGNLAGRLLVMHGLADDNVLPNHSTALFARLQREGKYYDSILYPGETHRISDKTLNRHRYGATLRYFNQHLKNSK